MSRILSAANSADIRVNLLLAVIGSLVGSLCTKTASAVALMALGVLWLCLSGSWRRGLKFALGFLCVVAIGRASMGIRQLTTFWMFSVMATHLLVPMAFIARVTERPTGTLLGALSAWHLPKPLGIATVVLLRFFPTIWAEFRIIRASLKFRGIGVSIWNVLAHPAKYFEYILIPLMMRTTRVAEELSAAAIVRGVRLNSAITSFQPVRFSISDAALTAAFGVLLMLVPMVEKMIGSGVHV